jgi:hypothetical protein
MKKIAFLCVLSIVLFAIFYLWLTSFTLERSLGWQFLPIVAIGAGAFWSLVEAINKSLKL